MLTRREFIRRCRDLSLVICGTLACSRQIAEGFIRLAQEPLRLAFIQGQNCLGCTVSLTYGNEFDFTNFIQRIVHLQVHPALSFCQGEDFLRALNRVAAVGDYILVVEGSVPAGIKEACCLGDQPLYDVLDRYAARARLVVCSGTCASYGGIPHAEGNPTGAISVPEYLRQREVRVPQVRIPGCPVHPDHLMGTVAYLAAAGKLPPLKEGCPSPYFDESIHNHCNRFQNFSQDKYALDYQKDKTLCLLKMGCRGPITLSDCPSRGWNDHTSTCIDSNTPCIGCKTSQWPFTEDLYLDANAFEDIPWSAMKTRTRDR